MNPLHLFYVNSIASLVATVSMIPMGLGVKDAGIALLFMKLGVSYEIAVVAALIERTMTTGLNTLIGACSAAILGVKFLDQKES